MHVVDRMTNWLLDNFGSEIRAIHELKTDPQAFCDIRARVKKADVRVCDRDFQVGDWLVLREWDPATGEYTGSQMFREITHIVPGGAYGLPQRLCVLSIR